VESGEEIEKLVLGLTKCVQEIGGVERGRREGMERRKRGEK